MAKDTHVTAPTRYVEANGIRYAYRRFGSESGTPLVFLQHFRGGLDNWDPLVTDGLAQGRPVILFNNAGVASSNGETPDTVDAMGDHLATFVNALRLPQIDVLGFSIGGYVAQSFVLRHPHLVRRLVLAGTGPRNGEPGKDPRILEAAGNPIPVCEDFLFLFFSPSEASQAAGRAFWERRHQRKDADAPSSIQTMKAQQAALMEWRQPRAFGMCCDSVNALIVGTMMSLLPFTASVGCLIVFNCVGRSFIHHRSYPKRRRRSHRELTLSGREGSPRPGSGFRHWPKLRAGISSRSKP
jgi:pimeloyl-ACP methyl ester carboxylesterase